jgi:hypothetical protein
MHGSEDQMSLGSGHGELRGTKDKKEKGIEYSDEPKSIMIRECRTEQYM